MSEQLSAEERKRLLRERRQAKMKQGKASERLNTILSQGSSVKADNASVSVLDKPDAATPSPGLTPQATASSNSKDNDPEVSDIDDIIRVRDGANPSSTAQEPNFDDMLSQIFGGGAPQGGAAGGAAGGANQNPDDPMSQMMMNLLNQQSDGSAQGDPMAEMMKNFFAQQGDESAAADAGPQNAYSQQLNKYNAYEQKVWKFRFLLIRYCTVLANFFYHYLTIDDLSFQSSSYSYVRGLISTTPTHTFITTFFSAELIILTSYYIIGTKKHLFRTSSEQNMIVKLLSMGSLVLPQLSAYQPLLIRLLGYWDLLGMFLSDISLVVVLFGLISFS